MNETQRHGNSKMCSHSGRSRAGGDPAGRQDARGPCRAAAPVHLQSLFAMWMFGPVSVPL